MLNTKMSARGNFLICCLISFFTYLIAWSHCEYGGDLPVIFKILYWVVSIPIVGFLLRNIGKPIFWNPLIVGGVARTKVVVFAIMYIVVFELIVVYGFWFVGGYGDIYKKYMILPQLLNLLWLWVLVCAMVGQKRFNSFVVVFMQNPWKAIGRALVDAVMGPPKL